MILIVTSSFAGSIDVFCSILEEKCVPFFRFNLDLWDQYSICFTECGFTITDPENRKVVSDEVDVCFAFRGHIPLDPSNNKYTDPLWIASTMNVFASNLLVWINESVGLRLFPIQEYRYPKFMQMKKASRYWSVSSWRFNVGLSMPAEDVMVKQLSQRPFDGKALFVQQVNAADLSPSFPWFIQTPARGNRDATVVFINGKVHCYQFEKERGSLTDWRVTQGTTENKWVPWNAGEEFEEKVRAYMQDMGLKYGRLDFIIGGDEPEFLEVNPCGQFGWLDDENHTLHREVLAAILDPSSAIEV